MTLLYKTVNALLMALCIIGHAAAGIFLTNTRLLGLRETEGKLFILLGNMAAWPLLGLVQALRSGGFSGFALSLLRPGSFAWLWRVAFTLLGARWLAQEVYRLRHPRPDPPELLSTQVESVDMRREITEFEGKARTRPAGILHRLNEIYALEVITHEVKLDRLPPEFDGFTILQISDVHYAHFLSAEYVRRYVDLCIDFSPDLIVLTGDYQTYPGDVECAARLLSPLGEWSRRDRSGMGTLAVMGNHDRDAGLAAVSHALRRAGIRVLNNEHVRLEREGASLYIAGVADPWGLKADLPLALHGIPAGSCTILLAHVPDFLVTAAGRGVDLQLSGHNHGGQVKLPLLGPVLVSSRYGRRYAGGFHKMHATLMYASRGLGGKPPIRFGCKGEITRFMLR
ncbi:MAG TPA: metallophosphoesterase [Chloroflexia bacterium]|jgi:hypothetical protein